MTLKRKTRNLPEINDTLADGNPRPIFGPESTINEDEQSSSEGLISITKISIRIKQIQNSIEQATTMLESMDKFKHLMPGAAEQREKLETIISNLEEQKASYTNLFDLITATEEERLTLMNSKSTNDDDLSLRRNIDLTSRAIEPSDISTKWEEQSSSSEDEEHVEYYSDECKEKDLLTDINQLRDRLKVLREIYEKKYKNEIEQRQSPSTPTGNRLKNLRNIRDRLDELEQIVNYYQTDLEHDEDKEIIVYNHEISDELRTKQLELEQAKTTLNQLQQMIQTIQPSPKKLDINDEQFLFSSNSSPRNEQIAAQHREIERLVESRQRLHTIQGQITSLHQTMTTPTKNIYEQQLNDSTNRRPIYQSNESLEEELLFPTRLKQSNVYASDTIVGRSTDDLNDQIREITRCLSTFIDEQKTFNRQIEHRLTNISNSSDPMFNQLQQQVLTQGLIVNLNTAYREIAVLQSEINALQSENTRLASSLSLDNQYFRLNSSKSSLSSQSTSRRMSNPRRQIFEDSEDERQFHNLSSTVFNIQPSSTNQMLNNSNIDVQTLDLQVKSIMVQLIPFMRFHINEIVDQSILNQIRERILFLLKQQPDSVQLIRYFQRQFSDLLGKKIEKYLGSTIRDCAADLIRDISDLVFAELVKYKSNTDDDKENQDEGNFNGHEHILVNRSINNHIVPKPELENESFL